MFLDKGVFFSIRVFFNEHSRITGLQDKGEGISLTPYYHFHPLNMRLDITRAITAESSPLHMAAGLEPGTFGFRAQVANHQATRPYVHSKVFWKYAGKLQENTHAEVFGNFIEITLRYWCSLVNLLHNFRTPFLKDTSGWPHLPVANFCVNSTSGSGEFCVVFEHFWKIDYLLPRRFFLS